VTRRGEERFPPAANAANLVTTPAAGRVLRGCKGSVKGGQRDRLRRLLSRLGRPLAVSRLFHFPPLSAVDPYPLIIRPAMIAAAPRSSRTVASVSR